MTLSAEFDSEIEIGSHIIEVTVDAGIEHEVDNRYGADADGNRGIKAEFIDVDWIVIKDKRLNDITEKVRIKHPDIYETICEEAIEIASTNEQESREYQYECYMDSKMQDYKDR